MNAQRGPKHPVFLSLRSKTENYAYLKLTLHESVLQGSGFNPLFPQHLQLLASVIQDTIEEHPALEASKQLIRSKAEAASSSSD